MAIEPLLPGEWLPSIKQVLDLNGYHTLKSKSRLLVWKDVITYKSSIIYTNGAMINRLWLDEKRWALSFINKRFYFKEDHVTIDSRPEYLIVNGDRPSPPHPQKQLTEVWKILENVKQSMKQHNPMPVEVEKIEFEKDEIRKIFIGSISRGTPSSTYNSLYKELGFDFVPKGMEIIICPTGSLPDSMPTDFINNLNRCLNDRNTVCGIKVTQLESIKSNLDILKNEKRMPHKGKCILFIMPSKKMPPNRDLLSLFGELERFNIPYRRAYRDDPFRFSVPNQLPSILLAAGGRPHRSPHHINGHPIWTVGFDMGHSPYGRFTKLALTLIDPDGILIKAWVDIQSLDETIQSEKITRMLKLCAKELKNYTSNPFIIFLRDGRFFEKDEIRFSKEIFGENLSIFEYRKNLNPQIVSFVNNEPTIINKAYAAIVPNSNTIFISTLETGNKKSLPKIAKVTWKKGWNGLELTPSQIAGLLLQSATSPGLGLQPRLLPASIYWADGIASTSEADLRFRGQPICKLY